MIYVQTIICISLFRLFENVTVKIALNFLINEIYLMVCFVAVFSKKFRTAKEMKLNWTEIWMTFTKPSLKNVVRKYEFIEKANDGIALYW